MKKSLIVLSSVLAVMFCMCLGVFSFTYLDSEQNPLLESLSEQKAIINEGPDTNAIEEGNNNFSNDDISNNEELDNNFQSSNVFAEEQEFDNPTKHVVEDDLGLALAYKDKVVNAFQDLQNVSDGDKVGWTLDKDGTLHVGQATSGKYEKSYDSSSSADFKEHGWFNDKTKIRKVYIDEKITLGYAVGLFGCIDNEEEASQEVRLMDITEFHGLDNIDMLKITDASFMFIGCDWAVIADNKIPSNLHNIKNAFAMLAYTAVSKASEKKGFSDEVINNFATSLTGATDLSYAFAKNSLVQNFDGTSLKITEDTRIKFMLYKDNFVKKVNISCWKGFPKAEFNEGWLNNVGSSLPKGEKVILKCNKNFEQAVTQSIPRDQRGRYTIDAPTAFWGIEGRDISLVLHLSSTCTELTPNEDPNIINGFDGDNQPWSESKNLITEVSFVNKIKFNSASFLFSSLTQCNHISSFECADFSECTNMSCMFQECRALKNLNSKDLNTTSVTSMYSMFGGCSTLEHLDLSSFSNEKVENIENMFRECSSLIRITADKEKWVGSHTYKKSSYVFQECSNLMGYNSTGQHSTQWHYKITDGSRASVDIDDDHPGYFTDNAYTSEAFWGLSSDNKTLYLSAEKTEHAQFKSLKILIGYGDSNSQPWNENKKDISNVIIESISSNDIMHFISAKNLFSGLTNCLSIADFNHADFSKCQNLSGMFSGCMNLRSLNLATFKVDNVTDMSYMFNNCSALKILDISSFSNGNLKNIESMFSSCRNLNVIKADGENWSSDHEYDSSNNAFSDCNNLVGYGFNHFTKWNKAAIDGSRACIDIDDEEPGYFTHWGIFDNSAFWGLSEDNKTLYLSADKTDNASVEDSGILFGFNESDIQPWAFAKSSITTVKIEHTKNNLKLISASYLFDFLEQCQEITGLVNVDFSRCKSMVRMFCECKKLQSLDLSQFNTNNVTDMSAMFYDCESLSVLDLTSFNTSKVGNMSQMFESCTSLVKLDLSTFSNEKLISIARMFYGCSNLETIRANIEYWKSDHVYQPAIDVFVSCSKLVGYNATGKHHTQFESSFFSDARACVDVDDNHPGYFTDSRYKPGL